MFGLVMGWTGFTSIFAWLPLARIIGRPEGYTWGILGLSGAGTEGPFWIFAVLTAFVVTMLWSAFRGPRNVFHPMLGLWHLAVAGVVVAGVASGGREAVFQGQGLHFAFPMWALALPVVLATTVVLAWILRDRRSATPRVRSPWGAVNTRLLLSSLGLMVTALFVFRAGTNYNWVTAAAILLTVAHWILLIESFARTSPANG
jgi:hypothetical protein